MGHGRMRNFMLLLKDWANIGLAGVISCECGASLHGMTTYPGETSLILLYPTTEAEEFISGDMLSYQYTPNYTEQDTEIYSGKMRLASPERCIVDMILYDRPYEFIIQALDDYPVEKREYLYSVANRYGVEREVIERYISEIPEWFNDG